MLLLNFAASLKSYWPGFALGFVCCCFNLNANAMNTQSDYSERDVKDETETETETETEAPIIHYDPCIPPSLSDQSSTTWLDKTHSKMSVGLCWQVNKIDGFFGNITHKETAAGFLRIQLGYQWEQTDINTTAIQQAVKARVRLPNINRYLHVLFTDDAFDKNTIPSTKNVTKGDFDYPTSRMGKLLGIERTKPVDFDIDIGSKSDDGPKLFARGRATFQFMPSDNSNLQLRQSLFWLDGLGYGQESELEYNQTISDDLLFRWITVAEFSEETEGLQIGQTIAFFKQLDEKRGLSYNFNMIGDTRPTLKVREYGFNMLFRRNFWKSYLFYEVEPSIFWPLEFQRDMSMRIVFRVEMQLGSEF